YRELSSARRTSSHAHIAAVLEKGLGSRSHEAANELAFHFENAGQIEKAVEALRTGAARAFDRAAHRDGMGLLDRARALLDTIAASPQRDLAEIRVCIEAGAAASQLGSFGDRRAESAFLRAHEIAERSEDLPQLFQASFGLAGYFVATAQIDRARTMVEELHV